MKDRCEESVCGQGRWGAFHMHQCHKKAIVERDGRSFCKIHDPEYKKDKYKEQEIKWALEREKQRLSSALTSAAPNLLEALKLAEAYITGVATNEPEEQDKLMAIIHSAIAKAKGESK